MEADNDEWCEARSFEKQLIEESYSNDGFKDGDSEFRYTVTLFPLTDDENSKRFVSAKLHVDSSPPYPLQPPVCKVTNFKLTESLNMAMTIGLTDHDLQELQKLIDDKAKKLIGDICINALIDVVKDYLTSHNKEQSSLHDEMEQRNLVAATIKSEQPKAENVVITEKTYPPCLQPGNEKVFNKHTLICSKDIKGDKGVFSSIDIKSGTGKQFLIHEYIMKLSAINLKSELENIQKEFQRYQKFPSHSNILRYFDLETNNKNEDCGVKVIHVLSGYCIPVSSFTLPIRDLKPMTIDILTGLQFLHNSLEIFHEKFTIESIYMNSNGKYQLADHSFMRRVVSSSTKSPFTTLSLKYSDASVSEKGKVLDVLLFGHLIYHVSLGYEVKECYPDIPTILEENLRSFIQSCVIRDKGKRASIDDLQSHPFIDDSSIPIYSLELNNAQNKISFSSDDSADEDSTKISPELEWQRSDRLKSDFDAATKLGTGGFGSVYKARNRIDGCFYAIKIVSLKRVSTKAISKMRKEVKSLSQLRHANIVRYNSTWFEEHEEKEEKEEPSTGNQSLSDGTSDSAVIRAPGDDSFDFDHDSSSESYDITFQESSSNSSLQKTDMKIRSMYFEASDEEDSDSNITFERSHAIGQEESQYSSRQDSPTLRDNVQFVMYIQMEFCENKTMRTAINNGLHEDEKVILRSLRQMVDALEHIHSLGMIHRDLKPENIFLDSQNNVKIGDFGLAVSNIPDCLSHLSFNDSDASHSGSIVGTTLYIAPEVASERKYSPKVDVYSLGVILFEMCHPPFGTRTERIYCLGDIRYPEVKFPPNSFKNPQLEKLTRSMLCHDVSRRPNANEIANNDILPPRLAEKGLEEIIRHISSGRETDRKAQFLKVLFNKSISSTTNQNYDTLDQEEVADVDSDSESVMEETDPRKTNAIIDAMREIFSKHGAVHTEIPFLLPKCDLTDFQDRPYNILSKNGYYQVLPCNLRLNLARHIVKNNISELKRFDFTQSFRRRTDKDPNPNPKSMLEGSFDIVTCGSPSIARAELFVTIIDVLKSIPDIENKKTIVYLNHSGIMASLLHYYQIPKIYHTEIISYIHRTFDSRHKSANIKEKLYDIYDDLNERKVNRLIEFMKYEGPIDQIHKVSIFSQVLYGSKFKNGQLMRDGLLEILQLLSMLSDGNCSNSEQVEEILEDERKNRHQNFQKNHKGKKFADVRRKENKDRSRTTSVSSDPQDTHFGDDLDSIDKLANQLNLASLKKSKVEFRIRPGIVNDPYCYSGLMFQVAVEIDSKTLEVVAQGGSYNLLLQNWQDCIKSSTGTLPYAIGVNFLLQPLANIIVSPYHCQVIVLPMTKNEREANLFYIMTELWKKDIQAELLPYKLTDKKPTDIVRDYNVAHVVCVNDGKMTVATNPELRKQEKGKDTKKTSFTTNKANDVVDYILREESLRSSASKSDHRRNKSRGARSPSLNRDDSF